MQAEKIARHFDLTDKVILCFNFNGQAIYLIHISKNDIAGCTGSGDCGVKHGVHRCTLVKMFNGREE